mmetsp:Transcript_30283/g.53235  ORF Transcript_30283/g.53235 Transcript_30283/m.53235 type:complete len:203 (-) Transcript_30283:1121-1729(-)
MRENEHFGPRLLALDHHKISHQSLHFGSELPLPFDRNVSDFFRQVMVAAFLRLFLAFFLLIRFRLGVVLRVRDQRQLMQLELLAAFGTPVLPSDPRLHTLEAEGVAALGDCRRHHLLFADGAALAHQFVRHRSTFEFAYHILELVGSFLCLFSVLPDVLFQLLAETRLRDIDVDELVAAVPKLPKAAFELPTDFLQLLRLDS